jgi:ribonuclease D
LELMLEHLSERGAFALDTESNSFHAYYPRICLIQITTFADRHNPDPCAVTDYIVDPLAAIEVGRLGPLLASDRHDVVMHAADNDILLLQREWNFPFRAIFDTQLAARILGWPKVGLGAILEERFGVASDKRLQRTDWSARPLGAPQLTYAQTDTHYLLALREILERELDEAGRSEEADEAFHQLAALDASTHMVNERTFWQMKASHLVEVQQTPVLQALWEWRESEAQRVNRPPFKIVGDDTLVAIAEARPMTVTDLRTVARFGGSVANRYGPEILRAVEEGSQRPIPRQPKAAARPESLLAPEDQVRYERLRRWRTATAEDRGVKPEIVFSNETLLEIVNRSPRTHEDLLTIRGIGPWKADAYGEQILLLVNGRAS